MVLQLSERFEIWICHSWQSADRPPCISSQSITECFAAWKRIREYQQNDKLPGQHYPNLNLSKPENAIPENHQIDHISGRNNPYVNISKPENTIPKYLKNLSPFMNVLHICDRFAAWKRDSWASANQTHCFTALHTFQRFAPRSQYSWTLTIRPSCRIVLQLSEFFETENAIPYNQLIDPIAALHRQCLNFCILKTESVNISRTTIFKDSTTHIWKFRSLKCDSWESSNRKLSRSEQPICKSFQASKHDS